MHRGNQAHTLALTGKHTQAYMVSYTRTYIQAVIPGQSCIHLYTRTYTKGISCTYTHTDGERHTASQPYINAYTPTHIHTYTHVYTHAYTHAIMHATRRGYRCT